jgi:hypothetical protein
MSEPKKSRMPEAIQQVILYCEKWLEESSHSTCHGTRIFTLKSSKRHSGDYSIRCQSCQCQLNEFVVDLSAIAMWSKPRNLIHPQTNEIFLDIPVLIKLVNVYLYDTFRLWDGYSLIEIAYRGKGDDGVYGLRYQPSILHGKYLFGN